MDEREVVGWTDAAWLNPPLHAETDGDALLVTTRRESDFWRTTSYGFVRDDGHALLTGFPSGSAVEVEFVARFEELYDQAGLMIRVDAQTWIKAGIEVSDGLPQLGAVVTRGVSDRNAAGCGLWEAVDQVAQRARQAVVWSGFASVRAARTPSASRSVV